MKACSLESGHLFVACLENKCFFKRHITTYIVESVHIRVIIVNSISVRRIT